MIQRHPQHEWPDAEEADWKICTCIVGGALVIFFAGIAVGFFAGIISALNLFKQ